MSTRPSFRTTVVAFLLLTLWIAAAAEEQFKSFHKIPAGAKVYVAPIPGGFDTYIIAGFQQKKVPLVVVTDRAQAEYEITGFSESDKAGWAKMLFLGSQHTNEQASIKMVNLKTDEVIFAYSVNKMNSVRGKQSAGEACAKHIKHEIE
ncbi:MAG: hypothetical protein ACLPXM_13815 [Terriglobales bacterium]